MTTAALPDLIVDTPSSALAIYAHPDDPDVACGGTLSAWAANDCAVTVISCTGGEKGSADPDVDPVELAVQRRKETAAAADFLGLPPRHLLSFRDGEIDEGALRAELVGWIRRVRPAVLVCPDPTAVFFGSHYYNHRDHRLVGWAALDAAAPAASSPLYFPEAGAAHQVDTVYLTGTLVTDAWVDISATVEAKVAAVTCHRSQLRDDPATFGDAVRLRAEEAGGQAGVGFAEGFRRLRLVG